MQWPRVKLRLKARRWKNTKTEKGASKDAAEKHQSPASSAERIHSKTRHIIFLEHS